MHEVDDQIWSSLEQLALGRGKPTFRCQMAQYAQDKIFKIVQNFDKYEVVDYCLKIRELMKMG